MTVSETCPWVSGGYFIVRPTHRTAFTNASLVPERFWTVSTCLAETAPDTWALDWVERDETERSAAASRFGIPPGQHGELLDWVARHFDEDFVWPNLLVTLAVAREFLATFVPLDSDAAILGLALQREDAETFLKGLTPDERNGGFARILTRCLPPHEGGVRLGSEVLGMEWGGGLHSSLCNGLEGVFSERWGVRPNAWGLWDDHELARRCAAYAGSEESGAEPVPWRACVVTRYPRE